MTAEQEREKALVALSAFGPEYGASHGANHGPMAVDALVAMGGGDAVAGFLGRYVRILSPLPPGVAPLRGDGAEAFGRIERWADLVALVGRELEAEPWRRVLSRWVPRLAPGVSAAAFHGLLRTAHASRALVAQETSLRLDELARGLAYWAARFSPLPVAAGARRGLTPAAALRALAPAPDALARGQGLISARIEARAPAHPELAGAIDWVDLSGEPGAVALRLGAAAAEVLVRYEQSSSSSFALLHGVTGMGAVSLLVPHLPDDAARVLLRHAWHGLAALRVCFAGASDLRPVPAPTTPIAALVADAVASHDDHHIKLTECCARGFAAGGGDVFLEAAKDR